MNSRNHMRQIFAMRVFILINIFRVLNTDGYNKCLSLNGNYVEKCSFQLSLYKFFLSFLFVYYKTYVLSGQPTCVCIYIH